MLTKLTVTLKLPEPYFEAIGNDETKPEVMTPDDIKDLVEYPSRDYEVEFTNFDFIESGWDCDDIEERYMFVVVQEKPSGVYYKFSGFYDSWEGVDWYNCIVHSDVTRKEVIQVKWE